MTKSKQVAIAGKKIKCPDGYYAFLPNPLPPQIIWSQKIVNALSRADHLLGRLAREGKRLPNPHILIRPFIRRESVFSSKIEGTRASLSEILAAEAGIKIEHDPNDLREVNNYVITLEYGIKRLNTLPLSIRLFKELHTKLMKGVRGEYAAPGEFRRTQNWIGLPGSTINTASFIPPPPDRIPQCMGQLELFLHEKTLPPLAQVALAHYQFEAIHPFLDGNGRIGRLLITLFLIERNVLPEPLLYLSAFFEATRDQYYQRLLAVSQKNDWHNWLIYFFNGVATQSQDALQRSEKINTLLVNWKTKIKKRAMPHIYKLLELIASNPFITIKKAAKELNVAYTTAQRAIESLVKLNILHQQGAVKRNKIYCAKKILDILEKPATFDNVR